MFLITGAGRQGTGYIAEALSACGLGVGHERMGKDGIASSFYCFEGAARYPRCHPAPRPDFDLILHQVRHPLHTIASMQTGRSWGWTCQFLSVGPGAPLLQKCVYNWLVFNRHAESQAAFTYQIEELEDVWTELRGLLGFDAPYRAISHIPTNVNTRPHDSVAWEDVEAAAPEIYDEVRLTAQRYGYV